MTPELKGPLARKTGLLVENLASETIVYDHDGHRVHCLNPTAAFVWRQCNGETTVEEITNRLPDAIQVPADPGIVLWSLQKLSKLNLLENGSRVSTTEPVPSRRELMRRLQVAGISALAILPAVSSLVAPTPAMAASRDNHDPGGPGDGKGPKEKKDKKDKKDH